MKLTQRKNHHCLGSWKISWRRNIRHNTINSSYNLKAQNKSPNRKSQTQRKPSAVQQLLLGLSSSVFLACQYRQWQWYHITQAAHPHHRKLREKHLRMKVSVRVRVESPDVGSRESVSVSCSTCSNHSQEPTIRFYPTKSFNCLSEGDKLRGDVCQQQQDFSEQVQCLSWFYWNEDELELSAKQLENIFCYDPFLYLSRTSSLLSRRSPGARSGSEGTGASTRSGSPESLDIDCEQNV